jgi:hypothetical protein
VKLIVIGHLTGPLYTEAELTGSGADHAAFVQSSANPVFLARSIELGQSSELALPLALVAAVLLVGVVALWQRRRAGASGWRRSPRVRLGGGPQPAPFEERVRTRHVAGQAKFRRMT